MPAQSINPPNPLRKAQSGSGPVRVDPAILERAESAVKELEGEFAHWAQLDIDGLRAAIEEARLSPDDQKTAIGDIYRHGLDLKGQGGGFGYDLITAIGDLLTKFMEGRKTLSERDIAIVTSHVDAMQAILREDIKGSDSEIGVQIVDSLRELTPDTGA